MSPNDTAAEIDTADQRPSSGIDRALNALVVLGLTMLVGLGFLQVMNRFLLAKFTPINITWTGQAARFLLIYLTFVGGIVASRDQDHIRIEVIVKRLPTTISNVADVTMRVASIVFIAVAVYGGILATQAKVGVQPGAVPYITMEYVYAIMPIGLTAMALYEFDALRRRLRTLLGGEIDG